MRKEAGRRVRALLLGLMLFFVVTSANGQDTFVLAPVDATVPPGQTGFIDLSLTGGLDIDAYTLDVTFDSSKLDFLSVSKDGTLSQVFPIFGGNQVEAGRVRITGAALGVPPISGNGILARVELRSKADAEGSATTCTENLQADLQGAATGCASVAIPQNTPTPTRRPTSTPIPTNTPTATYTPTPASVPIVLPLDVTIPPGQTGFVDVVVSGASEIDAYSVDLVINSSKLEFVAVSNIGTLSEDFLIFGGELVSVDRGRITAAALGALPISGDGTLFRAQLRSKANARGSATVSTDNPQQDLQGAKVGSATVLISTGSSKVRPDPTPKPTRIPKR